MSLMPLNVIGSAAGLQTNKKPYLIEDQAFAVLQNAYVYRDRVVKRQCLQLLSRLRRVFTQTSLGSSGASPWSFNIFSKVSPAITEPNAEIEPGSVQITLGGTLYTGNIVTPGYTIASDCEVYTNTTTGMVTNGAVTISGVTVVAGTGDPTINGGPYFVEVIDGTHFKLGVASNNPNWGTWASGGTWSYEAPGSGVQLEDKGDGTFTSTSGSVSAIINYITGEITITGAGTGVSTLINFNYFPSLPVMGVTDRQIPAINLEETIIFDTKYAYTYVGDGFQEVIPGTTWGGTDSDFFWTCNYQGSDSSKRLFFATNFVNDAADPMRYLNGSAWTTLAPAVSSSIYLFQAKILIPYYGRLLALNTWEGTTIGSSANYFARCRFSQIGDPTAVDAWRSDMFGLGGFIDAPTNESIISAIFYKNTLIVFFERTTWQLRYQGEYGLPFIWERISSDFGSESKMSPILFDEGVLAVGNRAIISSNSYTVKRIDLQIPDLVFQFRNTTHGVDRVQGVRDYQRELAFWCYCDGDLSSSSPGVDAVYPNKVLVYNYRNNTFAIFRDNVTAFGKFQAPVGVSWDSLNVFWDDEVVGWDDVEDNSDAERVICGNQQGYISYYGYDTPDTASLAITAITLTKPPVITVPNHNLQTGEFIYITNMLFVDGSNVPTPTTLNNTIYQVIQVDSNTLSLLYWNGSNYVNDFSYTPSTGTYIGGGQLALFPILNVQTKDFNPFMDKGMQVKVSHIDFLMEVTNSIPNSNAFTAMTVELFVNSSTEAQVISDINVGNQECETSLISPFQIPGSDISWHRFFATVQGQFFRIGITYDDNLMNQLVTHQNTWEMNSLIAYIRPGSKNTF